MFRQLAPLCLAVASACVLDWSPPASSRDGDPDGYPPPEGPGVEPPGRDARTGDVPAPPRDGARDAGQRDAATDARRRDAGGDRGADAPPADGAPVPPDTVLALRANGSACSADGECLSGHCADGRCCNLACASPCASCALPNQEGLCTPVPQGADPPAGKTCGAPTTPQACGLDGHCDGRGGCSFWPAGTTCADTACAPGVAKGTLNLPSLCDGKGSCTSLGSIDCAPYQCDPALRVCTFSCSKDKQCTGGAKCIAGRCGGEKQPLGTPCLSGNMCASSHCVDGACCDSACSGSCVTCGLTDAKGRCLAVPAGQLPIGAGRSCPDVGATAPCGPDGACDGAGLCRVRPAGTPCAAPSCSDGPSASAVAIPRCNGDANDPQCSEQLFPCGAYLCQPQEPSCFGRCADATQCRDGSCSAAAECL